jgi:hypothetical protein
MEKSIYISGKQAALKIDKADNLIYLSIRLPTYLTTYLSIYMPTYCNRSFITRYTYAPAPVEHSNTLKVVPRQ